MADDPQLLDDVAQIVHDALGVDPEQVRPEARFVADLGADWLAVAEIVLACEDRFDVDLPAGTSREVATVADLLARLRHADTSAG